ncbi:MAG: ATP-binding protein [Candidatus Gastranaerophilales bacterium]|nr:ATP-binding protein [Candidatus Gastranaerophilales bacterium]
MSKNPSKIVIVDDEPMVTASLKALLSLEGIHNAEFFNSPMKALEFIKNNSISLIMSDFLMPEMNGIEFLTKVKEIHPEISLILLTGYADKENAIKAINDIGIYKYIEKPWDNDSLLLTIRNGIERSFLVKNLNQKIDELSKTKAELENYNEKLELTVRNRTQDLMRANSKLSGIITNCADGIVTISTDDKIIHFNASFVKLTALAEQDLNNTKFSSLFINNKNKNIFEEISSQKDVFIRDYLLINQKEEKNIPVEISFAPIQTKNEVSNSYVAVIRDITPQLEAERLRDDFIATLTHDLRTPLLAAIQTLQFFLDGSLGELNGRQFQLLSTMISSNQDMLGLVNALLEVYKYESGQLSLYCENINLNEILDECISKVTPLAEKKNIIINKNLKNIIQGYVDKQEIRRVFANLLGNAVNYTYENGNINVSMEDINDEIIVCVEDTGMGIPNEDIPKMFKRFSQGTKQKRSTGTGLGLYLSRQIIEAHYGKIWLESELEKGSKFFFSLKKCPSIVIADKSCPTELVSASQRHDDSISNIK